MKAIARSLAVLLLAAPLSAAAPQDEQPPSPAAQAAEISSRMQQDVSRLLEELVGRGRARSFVTVEGEMIYQSKSESGPPPEEAQTLPGYASVNILEKTGEYIKQQREESQRTAEFKIKKLSVSLVFDRSIPDERVNAIKLMIAEVLRVTEARGDSIITAKTDMMPLWKSALQSPEVRPVLVAAAFGALALAVLLAFGYILASKLLTGFVDYARINAPASVAGGAGPGAAGPSPAGEAGELGLEGELGEIIDVEAKAAGGGMLTAGSAFEFMEKLPPAESADLLADLPDEDAAIIIANLADRKPHVSSKILLALPPAKKQNVSAQLLGLKQAEPDRVYEIENDLRLKLEKSLKVA